MYLKIYPGEDVNLRKLRKQTLIDILVQNNIEHDPNVGRSQLLRLFNSSVYSNRLQILNEYWQSLAQTETESDASNLYFDANDHFSIDSSLLSSSINSTHHSSHSSLEADLPDISHFTRVSPTPNTDTQIIASGSSRTSSSNIRCILTPRPFYNHQVSSYHNATGPTQPLFGDLLSIVDDHDPLARYNTRSQIPPGPEPLASRTSRQLTNSIRGFSTFEPLLPHDMSAYHNTFGPRQSLSLNRISTTYDYRPSPEYITRPPHPFDFHVPIVSSTLASSSNRQDAFVHQSLFRRMTVSDCDKATDSRESFGYAKLPSEDDKTSAGSVFKYFKKSFRMLISLLARNFAPILLTLIIYGSIYVTMEIKHFISTELSQIGILLIPPFSLFFTTTIVKLRKTYNDLTKRRASQKIKNTVVDKILSELKRKCALWERSSFFHPHPSLPIRDFYNQFIQAYPEHADLWEEIFSVIDNHKDIVTVKIMDDGEEVDAWDYRPRV